LKEPELYQLYKSFKNDFTEINKKFSIVVRLQAIAAFFRDIVQRRNSHRTASTVSTNSRQQWPRNREISIRIHLHCNDLYKARIELPPCRCIRPLINIVNAMVGISCCYAEFISWYFLTCISTKLCFI